MCRHLLIPSREGHMFWSDRLRLYVLICTISVSGHLLTHNKSLKIYTHKHTHMLGMYLMKGWSAAIVTKQVVSGVLHIHRNQQRLLCCVATSQIQVLIP